MEMNFSNFIELRPAQRRTVKTLTIYDNGKVKVSSTLFKEIGTNQIDVRISPEQNMAAIIKNEEGGALKVKQDGTCKVEIADLKPEKYPFPLIYEMEPHDEDGVWGGTIKLIKKANPKKTKNSRSFSELV